MLTRPIFVAGATGATGRTVVRLADERQIPIIPHVRIGREHPYGSRAAVLDLEDSAALEQVLGQCGAVMQLIGTMRKRFALGDTYESSDIRTTEQLLAGARKANVRSFILLSSVGAGRPMGRYLQAKAQTEALVRASGIPYTIFRPASFVGEGHQAPLGMSTLTRLLGLHSLRPIAIADLAAALLHVAVQEGPTASILEGESLWAVVKATAQY